MIYTKDGKLLVSAGKLCKTCCGCLLCRCGGQIILTFSGVLECDGFEWPSNLNTTFVCNSGGWGDCGHFWVCSQDGWTIIITCEVSAVPANKLRIVACVSDLYGYFCGVGCINDTNIDNAWSIAGCGNIRSYCTCWPDNESGEFTRAGYSGSVALSWNNTGCPNWDIDIYYPECQVVINDGNTYVCIQSHTSSIDDEPGIGDNWEDYWQQI